jgi:DNA-directed RNA polymerase subunit beta'
MAVLKVLDVNKFVKSLKPVTSTELKTRTGEFAPEGLLSEEIFGNEGSLDRAKKFSYINLNTKIIHPTLYRHIIKLERKLEKMFSTESSFLITSAGEIREDDNGITGIAAFIENFPKIKFRDLNSSARKTLIENLTQAYKDGTLFIDVLPVVPPDVRPVSEAESGELMIDELNNVYIDILRKSFQVKSSGSSGQFFDLLSYGLQISVNNHDRFIQSKIEKKRGLIRGNILGKRVDFTGRAVITPGPDLKVNEIGLPLRFAVSIFQPFIIHQMIFNRKYPFKIDLANEVEAYTKTELSVESLQRVLKAIKNNDSVPDKLVQLIYDATEISMKGRMVIAKRDPVLHEQGVRGYYPKLIMGNTIQLCTMQVEGHNADFDGDTMTVYHPLTKEAQDEIKEKMTRVQGAKNTKSVTFGIVKEMNLGLFVMTKDIKSKQSPVEVTQDDLDKATDPYIPVIFRKRVTTMGRALFNNAFPPDFPFVDEPVTKSFVNKLIPIVLEKYGQEKTIEIFSTLEKLGFKFATIVAPSFNLDNLTVSPEIDQIKEKIKTASPEEAFKLIEQGKKILEKNLRGTGLHDLVQSGSSKGWDQPSQMLISKGVIADPQGRVLDPIASSFADGLKPSEYFKASAGSRKGMADRALNTSTTGYFSRKLAYLLNAVEAHPSLNDCKTQRTITVRLTSDLMSRLTGRYIIKAGRLKKFEAKDFKIGDTIQLRSPIYCVSQKICHTCYGDLLRRQKTPYVGLLAGQAVGERGTQLIMRTFHTGGAATMAKRDIFQDIINNDPLVNLEK